VAQNKYTEWLKSQVTGKCSDHFDANRVMQIDFKGVLQRCELNAERLSTVFVD
jgi:hypothetical protein